MKMNKANRKWLALPLCAGLMASLIGPGTIGFAEEVVEQWNQALHGGPSTEHIVQVPNQEPSITVELNNDLSPFENFQSEEQVVYESVEIQPKVNPSITKSLAVDVDAKDLYQVTQDQMEQLLSEGYAIEDLYRLDELANKQLIDPMALAKRKADSGLDWDELEVILVQEMEQKQLNELAKAHPQPYAQFKKEQLKDEDILNLLIAYDTGKGTVAELLGAYKTGGEKAVASYQSKSEKQLMQTNNAKTITSSVDTDTLERIRSLSKETGISETELLRQLQAAKEASKQALAGKE
ncbi:MULTISPECIES: hypothetical protein [Paenibacillus]|uniref:hypothetical protein n=1 Tax=Paenibacillus TaxID=44249 RepID=UPI00048CFB58|nr:MULTISPECIES: hypothetical protein [unclassified Paenibacillus]MCT2197493.1 hypothetical protein [Paenibacillus sp. p3-SID1389]